MIRKTKEPGMSNTEQTWCVSSGGGSRSSAETKNPCCCKIRKMLLVWACPNDSSSVHSSFCCCCWFLKNLFCYFFVYASSFALICVCFGFSIKLKHFLVFLDCQYVGPENSTMLKHEQVDDYSFQLDSFSFSIASDSWHSLWFGQSNPFQCSWVLLVKIYWLFILGAMELSPELVTYL